MSNDTFTARDRPDIRIDDGWYLSDVETLDDCLDAEEHLEIAIVGIETQIEEFDGLDHDWLKKAKQALRFKMAALKVVRRRKAVLQQEAKQERRAHSRNRDSLLVDYIVTQVAPETFARWVRESGCRMPEQEDLRVAA